MRGGAWALDATHAALGQHLGWHARHVGAACIVGTQFSLLQACNSVFYYALSTAVTAAVDGVLKNDAGVGAGRQREQPTKI